MKLLSVVTSVWPQLADKTVPAQRHATLKMVFDFSMNNFDVRLQVWDADCQRRMRQLILLQCVLSS